jgi:hypothetical protein
MEKIGNLLKQNDSPVLKSSGSTTTALSLPEPLELPQWAETLTQVAQDKRHDLAPGILRLWREKLKSYRDAEINEVLLLYSGEFFPSVDAITEIIERRREVKGMERGHSDWERWKAENERAQAEGRVLTPEQMAEFMNNCKEIFARSSKQDLQQKSLDHTALHQARVLKGGAKA